MYIAHTTCTHPREYNGNSYLQGLTVKVVVLTWICQFTCIAKILYAKSGIDKIPYAEIPIDKIPYADIALCRNSDCRNTGESLELTAAEPIPLKYVRVPTFY